MNEQQIRTQLTDLVRTELRIDQALPEGNLSEHLDSVQRLTLVVAIEDSFKICFEPQDEAAIETLADVVQTIQAKLDNPVEKQSDSD
jgi:acyl carrier protein